MRINKRGNEMQDEMLSFLYPESYSDEADDYEVNIHEDIQDALDCADYDYNF
jgi:hypothetical protein